MKTFDEHVEDLANAIVSARDFAGNESAAISEYMTEHGFPRISPERGRVTMAAMERADKIWRGS